MHNAVSLLVLTGDDAQAAEILQSSHHLSQSELSRVIKLAKRKINLASEINKKEEIGKRIIQLDELYKKSLESEDAKTALLTIKEKSKLLDLYSIFSQESFTEASENIELGLTRNHLEGIGITDKGLPIEELARQIALYVINDIQSRKLQQA